MCSCLQAADLMDLSYSQRADSSFHSQSVYRDSRVAFSGGRHSIVSFLACRLCPANRFQCFACSTIARTSFLSALSSATFVRSQSSVTTSPSVRLLIYIRNYCIASVNQRINTRHQQYDNTPKLASEGLSGGHVESANGH